jgi:hypothetical protein
MLGPNKLLWKEFGSWWFRSRHGKEVGPFLLKDLAVNALKEYLEQQQDMTVEEKQSTLMAFLASSKE